MKDEHKSGEESQNMKVYSSETTVEGQAIFSGNILFSVHRFITACLIFAFLNTVALLVG